MFRAALKRSLQAVHAHQGGEVALQGQQLVERSDAFGAVGVPSGVLIGFVYCIGLLHIV